LGKTAHRPSLSSGVVVHNKDDDPVSHIGYQEGKRQENQDVTVFAHAHSSSDLIKETPVQAVPTLAASAADTFIAMAAEFAREMEMGMAVFANVQPGGVEVLALGA
jgi:hypothetical protein